MVIKTSDVLIRAKEILNLPGVWIRYRLFDQGRTPATDPKSWDESDSAFGTSTPNLEYDGSQQGQHCLLGAVLRAKYELGVDRSNHDAAHLLHKLANKVARQQGKPLSHGKRLAYRRGRVHDAAWFNNTADSLDEVNNLLCEGIKKAVEKELNESK